MEAVTKFFNGILSQFTSANFALLAIIDFSAFAAVFACALLGCILSPKIRAHDKRAFLCAVNAFTAITLAVFLIKFTLAQSLAVAALFWVLGYALYGALCLFKVKEVRVPQPVPAAANVFVAPANRPVRPQSAPAQSQPNPAAANGVRLEHALSIADKLLLKNLGRGDRQELEKIKTALTVLKVKGLLTPQDGGALNEMFNALLKLMAKYDL